MRIAEITGARIKTLLEARNMSQKEFAMSLGFSPGYVSDILRGRTKPSLEFLIKLGEEYNTTIDWLVTGEGPKFREKDITSLVFHVTEKLRRKLCNDPPSADVAIIPKFGKDVLGQLPNGTTINTELYPAADYCILPKDRAKSPKVSFCFEITDNDMAPYLPQGSCVVVNTSIRGPTQLKGSLCAFWSEGKLQVRYLRLTPRHLIFEPIIVDNDPICFELKDNPVAGKVESAWCYFG